MAAAIFILGALIAVAMIAAALVFGFACLAASFPLARLARGLDSVEGSARRVRFAVWALVILAWLLAALSFILAAVG